MFATIVHPLSSIPMLSLSQYLFVRPSMHGRTRRTTPSAVEVRNLLKRRYDTVGYKLELVLVRERFWRLSTSHVMDFVNDHPGEVGQR